MKEILFRGKRVDNGEWVYGFLVEALNCVTDKNETFIIEQDATYFTYGEFACTVEVEPETVGQFTGLCDKNGRKVFEGDIVLFEDESPTNYEYHDCTEMRCGEIKFGDGAFYITNRIAVEMEDLLYCGELDCEVIGNIHDNPELLEVEK